MESINTFLSKVHSEESFPVTEQEYAEVMSLMAEDDFEGYGEWSLELEQGQRVNTPNGEILINKECSHADCHTTRCDRAQSYRGIAI